MQGITRCAHSSLMHFFSPFCPHQSLVERVAKVFFYGLGLVILWLYARPKTIEGRIWIDHQKTGSVGMGRKYRFGETLQLKNGTPLQVAKTDFYVNTKIEFKGQTMTNEFPSSLFVQARDGNTICFRRNGQLHRLTLTPSKESSFDDCFKNVEEHFTYGERAFLYKEDIPKDFFQWSKAGAAAPVFLSPETRQIMVGEKGLSPINFGALELVAPHVPKIKVISARKIPGEAVFRFRLFVHGTPKITILVDRHLLYIHTFEDIQHETKGRINSSRKEHFLCTSCEDEKSTPLYAEASASLDNGNLILDIPLLPKSS